MRLFDERINPNLTLYRQKPAKGTARVCQKYVGESDYADPARHYHLLLNIVIWQSLLLSGVVSRAAFIRAHGFAVILGLLHRGVPQIFLPAPLCPLCRPLFKYRQKGVYLIREKDHTANSSPQHKANPNLLGNKCRNVCWKKVVEGFGYAAKRLL